MRSVWGFMRYDECLCGRRVRRAPGCSGTSGRWLHTLRGKSQSVAYYGSDRRRSRNCSGYLFASCRRAVSKGALRHIGVLGPPAPPAPRLRKDDVLWFCRALRASCRAKSRSLLDCERLLFYFVAAYHHCLNASLGKIKAVPHNPEAFGLVTLA